MKFNTEIKDLDYKQVEYLSDKLNHTEIIELRNKLKQESNPNYLLRCLWYDYNNNEWI